MIKRRRVRWHIPCVYFVQDHQTKLIKIGTTTDARSRFGKIAKDTVAGGVCLGFMTGGHWDERLLHSEYAAYRVKGEWFQPCPSLLAYIERNAKPSVGGAVQDCSLHGSISALIGLHRSYKEAQRRLKGYFSILGKLHGKEQLARRLPFELPTWLVGKPKAFMDELGEPGRAASVEILDQDGMSRLVLKEESALDISDCVQIVRQWQDAKAKAQERLDHYVKLAVDLHGPQVRDFFDLFDKADQA